MSDPCGVHQLYILAKACPTMFYILLVIMLDTKEGSQSGKPLCSLGSRKRIGL